MKNILSGLLLSSSLFVAGANAPTDNDRQDSLNTPPSATTPQQHPVGGCYDDNEQESDSSGDIAPEPLLEEFNRQQRLDMRAQPALDVKNFIGDVSPTVNAIIRLLESKKTSRSLLLLGKPGTGKTTLAQYIATKTGRDLYHIIGSDLVGKYRGHSKFIIQGLFDQARSAGKPAIIFIDEIANTAKKSTDHDTREDGDILTTLFQYIDECAADKTGLIYVITATYQERSSLDPAFRSRFDIVEVNLPNQKERADIIRHYLKEIDTSETYSRPKEELDALSAFLAKKTNGCTRRDIIAIIGYAKRHAVTSDINKIYKQAVIYIQPQHIIAALAEFKIERAKDNPGFLEKLCPGEKAHRALTIATSVAGVAVSVYGLYVAAKYRTADIERSTTWRSEDIARQDAFHAEQLPIIREQQQAIAASASLRSPLTKFCKEKYDRVVGKIMEIATSTAVQTGVQVAAQLILKRYGPN